MALDNQLYLRIVDLLTMQFPLPSTTQELIQDITLIVSILALLFGTGVIPRFRAWFVTPTTAEAWIEKGLKNRLIGKHEEAIGCFDKALEIDPENIDAWNGKVHSPGAIGRSNEQDIAFNKILGLTALQARKKK